MVVDQWFGGGIDLTPYYIDNFDINHFHKSVKFHVINMTKIIMMFLRKIVIIIFGISIEKKREGSVESF